MWEDLKKETKNRMMKTIDSCHSEIGSIRAGKAHPSLVQNIQVNIYGSNMRISDIATVTTPETRSIIIEAWDSSNADAICKAISESENLGLSPSKEKNKIRITIPELSEERRRDVVKMISTRCESFKVAIRNIRRDALDELKLKEDESSEDEIKTCQTKTQELTNEFIAKIEEMFKNKKEEISFM